jgi:biopolymer transport protein TolQ
MTETTTLWGFIAQAAWVVKLVLLILLAASILSWSIIIQRVRLLRESRRLIAQFEKSFREGADIHAARQKIGREHSDLSRIFHAGIQEYERSSSMAGITLDRLLDNCRRAMSIAQQERVQQLESHVPLLATIGSTAPYVGLFGTVWGIMSSFQMLGGVQQATLAMVAPGISEALIATAVGLFAAIPAVIAYNRFANQIDTLQQRYDIFQEKMIGILQQQFSESGKIPC